ncbi:MAG: RNAase [Ignavibacteriae bacterium]|nr:RNAase [Ignavibacteriota bacterium]
MNQILNKNLFFVKEHRGIFKAANNYDIFDPNTQQMIMTCREEKLGIFTKIFRFTDYKRATPFDIEIKTVDGRKVLTVKRGISIFLSNVEVFDENDILVGRFKQKFFTIGGKFDVLDASDNVVCSLKGKWTSWNFDFIRDEFRLAHVSKKWAGIGREMFTSADNYMLEIDNNVPQNDPVRLLILAAVMCIDMVLKE